MKDVNIDEISVKDTYTYSDILSLKLSEGKSVVKKTIGQKFMMENKVVFAVDPFDVSVYDDFLLTYAENIVSTENKHLLFEFDKPLNNIIYMCLASDVVDNAIENDISVENTIKIYFPFLFEKANYK